MPLDEKQRSYEAMADTFDEVMNLYDLRRRLEIVRELAGDSLRGKRVLDAGCGTGHFSRILAEVGCDVYSVDVGVKLLALTREKSGSKPAAADAAMLPFPGASFDAVVSSEMIEHTVDPLATVRDLLRVLKPGGRFVLTTPNRRWHFAIVLANALGVRPYDGYENWVSMGQLLRCTREAGLEPTESFGFHLTPIFGNYLRPFDILGKALPGIYVNLAVAGNKRDSQGNSSS